MTIRKFSSEIGNFVESLTDVEKRSLEEISLAVFGHEVILGLEYHQILKEIYDSGMFVVDLIVGLAIQKVRQRRAANCEGLLRPISQFCSESRETSKSAVFNQ
jgi:hypothetical protein